MDTVTQLPAIRIEVYRDENKRWWWQLISKSDVRAKSSQGYVSKQGCLIALRKVRDLMQDAQLIEIKK